VVRFELEMAESVAKRGAVLLVGSNNAFNNSHLHLSDTRRSRKIDNVLWAKLKLTTRWNCKGTTA